MERTLLSIFKSLKQGEIERIKIKRKYRQIGLKDENGKYTIFLSVSKPNSQALVVQGKGKSLKKAICNSINTFLNYNQNPNKKSIDSIMMEIVISKSPLKTKKKNSEQTVLELNTRFNGLAFDNNLELAFTANELTSYQIVRSKKLIYKNVKNAYAKKINRGENDLSRIKAGEQTLYSFKTLRFFLSSEFGYKVINRDFRMDELDRSYLKNSIMLTKDFYFKNALQENGKFLYSYLPSQNKTEKKYNILRHSGTIYSMIETYEMMPDGYLLRNIEKAIDYLLDKIKDVNLDGTKAKVVVERDYNKLGGNALAVVALAKYTTVTGNEQYLDYMQGLSQWIIKTQDSEGRFTIHKQKYSTQEITSFISRFYPGEAILALMRFYQITKDTQLLDAAEKAADYLINKRDRNETVDTITPDHWLLYGLNEIYTFRPLESYLNHTKLMVDAMLSRQLSNENSKRTDWHGGFQTKVGRAPGLTTTACWSEGLGATYELAGKANKRKLQSRIKNALVKSISYQLRAQLRPESVMFFENKDLCLGGIPKSLYNNEIRIDYVQHNISSFISLYNILNEKSGAK